MGKAVEIDKVTIVFKMVMKRLDLKHLLLKEGFL